MADWSEDGKQLVFVRAGNLVKLNVPFLYTMPPTQPSPYPAVAKIHTKTTEAGAWPHFYGNILLFARKMGSPARWDLFTVVVDDGAWTDLFQVTNTTSINETEPVWSKDGYRILYVSYSGNAQSADNFPANAGIYSILSSGGKGLALNFQSNEHRPNWMP